MSGFAIPPLSSGMTFDISQFSGGMDKVHATAASFPALIAHSLDAPLKQSSATMAQSVHEMGGHLDQLKGKAEIHGHADLDASGIEHGMLSAEATMQLFPAMAIEFIENPMLGAVAAAKEGLEGLAEAAKKVFEKIGETTKSVADHFQQINLGSISTGLSPEDFSKYAAAAKACGVDIETFKNGLELMGARAANALEGDVGAAKGFEKLGISAKQLAGMLDDSKAMMLAVGDGLKGMDTQSQRTSAAMESMGRGGKAMLSFLQQGGDGMTALADHMGNLGAKVTAEDAAMGAAWGKVHAEFSYMWEGIETALAKPILEFLSAHMKDIMPMIEGVAKSLEEGLGGAMTAILPGVTELASALGGEIGDALKFIGPALQSAIPLVLSIFELGLALFDAFKPELMGIGWILKVTVDQLTAVFDTVAAIVHLMTGDLAGATRSFAAAIDAGGRLAGDFGADTKNFRNPLRDDVHADAERAVAENAVNGGLQVLGFKDTAVTVHNHFNVDPQKVGDQVAKKTGDSVKKSWTDWQKELSGKETHRQVAQAFGGRR